MTKKERVTAVLALLDEHYRGLRCYLDYESPWQLLVATILSAQCTDARVNIVTGDLFKAYPCPEAMAAADISELEQIIRSTGFYHAKARHIKKCSEQLLTEYGGQMPCEMERLVLLSGVGRKTANVIRSHIFNIPSIVVDTHVKRISKKLGFTGQTEPARIEADLMKLLPEEHWIRYNLQIIAHGRAVCVAGRPKCRECILKDYCASCADKG